MIYTNNNMPVSFGPTSMYTQYKYFITYDTRRYSGGPKVTFKWRWNSTKNTNYEYNTTVVYVQNGGFYSYKGK